MQQNKTNARARGGITILCFLIILIGQFYLLRNIVHTDSFSIITMPWSAELIFALILIGTSIYLFIQPMGWYTKKRLAVAFITLIAYIALNVLYYAAFKEAYLAGFSFEYASSAGGLVGLKLVLAVVGVTAGIPVAQPIDGREYARRLREKIEKNNAQLTKETAVGAQQDLRHTIKKLKETMSPKELAAFLQELQNINPEAGDTAIKIGDTVAAAHDEIAAASPGTDSISPDPETDTEMPLTEKWRGWGGGV